MTSRATSYELVAIAANSYDVRGQSSSGSSRRASQVAKRSTGVSNSGGTSVNSWRRSASQARVTSSSPRLVWSSSMPRSVKYTDLVALLDRAADRFEGLAHDPLELLHVPAVLADRRRAGRGTRDHLDRAVELVEQVQPQVRGRTHVGRLVLDPADVLEVREPRDLGLQLLLGTRVELLDPGDGRGR